MWPRDKLAGPKLFVCVVERGKCYLIFQLTITITVDNNNCPNTGQLLMRWKEEIFIARLYGLPEWAIQNHESLSDTSDMTLTEGKQHPGWKAPCMQMMMGRGKEQGARALTDVSRNKLRLMLKIYSYSVHL